MKVYEAYKAYLALSLHFKSEKYDYFKYNGAVSASESSFDKRKDKFLFARIAKEHDPVGVIAASFIFHPKKPYLTDMTRENYLELVKYKNNGLYLFERDLKELKNNFNDNFSVDNSGGVPYILQLYMNGVVSIHTLCVFESLLGMNGKWKKSANYIIFEEIMSKVVKSLPFFEIDNKVYGPTVRKHFSNLKES